MAVLRRSLLSLYACTLVLSCTSAFGQRITAVLQPGRFYSNRGVANPVTNKIYFSDQLSDTVRVVDGATNQIDSVNVGRGPVSIAVNTVTNKIYVVNDRDNTITAIDGSTLSTGTVAVGTGPAGIAVNPTTNKIYVANSDDNTVTVVDGSTLQVVATVRVDEGPLAIAVNSLTNKIYVGNQRFVGGSSVTVIDGATNQVIATLPLGFDAYFYPGSNSLLVNTATNQIYALGYIYLYGIDGPSNQVYDAAEWQVSGCVTAIALNNVTNRVYAADPCSGGLDEYDGTTHELNSFFLGLESESLSVDEVNNRVYLADPYYYVFAAFDRNARLVTDINVQAVEAVVANGASNTIYLAGGDIDVVTGASPLQFKPVTPCRLFDTRSSGPITGGSPVNFDLLSAGCGLPATAAAYSLNVTLVPVDHGHVGYLTIWPTDQFQPEVSTMNSSDGRVKANAAIVPAGTLGQVSVYVSNTTNVIIDTNGYFAPAGQNTYQFYTVPPCRVIDTRNANGDLGGPNLHAQVERDFPVRESSCIPAGVNVAAYSMNFTAIPHPAHHPLGYLTVWPEGQPLPNVSTLNNPTGTVVANAAIVPAGTNGGIAVYAYNDTDLAVDINGYFAAPGQRGLSLNVFPPCRDYDSRQRDGDFIGERTISGNCFFSTTAQAYVFNATVVPTEGPMGYLTLWPDSLERPAVSTLNAYDGLVTSNMAIVPNINGATDAFALNYTHLILDISGYFAPQGGLSVVGTEKLTPTK